MSNFNVQWFELQGDTRVRDNLTYMIALSPSSRSHGAQRTKVYISKEAFAGDLKKRVGLSDRAIEAFFSDPTQHNALLHHPLTDEDAAYLGWHTK